MYIDKRIIAAISLFVLLVMTTVAAYAMPNLQSAAAAYFFMLTDHHCSAILSELQQCMI